MLIERSGHADDHRIHLGNLCEVGGCRKSGLLGLPNCLILDAHDVRSAIIQLRHLGCIGVESRDPELLLAEEQGQRQPHVAQADNAHPGFARLHLLFQCRQGKGRSGRH